MKRKRTSTDEVLLSYYQTLARAFALASKVRANTAQLSDSVAIYRKAINERKREIVRLN